MDFDDQRKRIFARYPEPPLVGERVPMSDEVPGLAQGVNDMIELNSTITCPECGHRWTGTMPTDACQYIYVCEKCVVQLKPKKGDCCVYCSYGDVPCPPIQEERMGLGSAACCGGTSQSS